MTADEAVGIVNALIVALMDCNRNAVLPTAHLVDDLFMSDLDVVVELACDIEEALCIEVYEEDADLWLTVGDVHFFVVRRLGLGAAA
jgi:acyl carrier protein